MTTYLLTTDTNDLVLQDGNFVIIEGNDEIKQNLTTRLQVFLGEFFYDRTAGAPYTSTLGNNRQLLALEVAVKNIIIGTPGILKLDIFETNFNSINRVYTINFSAQLDDSSKITINGLTVSV